MKLINKNTKKIISKNLKIARSFSEKSVGLLKEKSDVALFFQTRFGIHTFFMKYPITVLVLDKENKIIQIKRNLKPNRIFIWNPKYSKIIELPTTTTNCKIGEILFFES